MSAPPLPPRGPPRRSSPMNKTPPKPNSSPPSLPPRMAQPPVPPRYPGKDKKGIDRSPPKKNAPRRPMGTGPPKTVPPLPTKRGGGPGPSPLPPPAPPKNISPRKPPPARPNPSRPPAVGPPPVPPYKAPPSAPAPPPVPPMKAMNVPPSAPPRAPGPPPVPTPSQAPAVAPAASKPVPTSDWAGMLPSKVPSTTVWEGRFTFKGSLPNPPRYTNCNKVYLGGNKNFKCPAIGETIQCSTGPSPEVKAAAERDQKIAALQKELEAAGKAGDFEKVKEISARMKEVTSS